uniref:Ubiquitin-like domain-containing protein n=1 Tax=Poecilia formosa TaxID=48698 RepID=A0A096MEB9_POEFO
MGKTYQVLAYGLRGKEVVIDLCDTEEQMQSITVGQLKDKILEKMPGILGRENLLLIFAGKILKGDTSLLLDYGIQNMSVILTIVTVRDRGGGGM